MKTSTAPTLATMAQFHMTTTLPNFTHSANIWATRLAGLPLTNLRKRGGVWEWEEFKNGQI